MKLVVAIVGGLVNVGLWTMVCCGFELGLFELGCTRDRCRSFAKVAIMLSELGCDSLVVVWVASGLVVVMEVILIVGSPVACLAGLPLALRRDCCFR